MSNFPANVIINEQVFSFCLSAAAIRQAASGDDFITSCSFKMAGDESGATLGQPHLARQDLNSLVSLDFLSIL